MPVEHRWGRITSPKLATDRNRTNGARRLFAHCRREKQTMASARYSVPLKLAR